MSGSRWFLVLVAAGSVGCSDGSAQSIKLGAILSTTGSLATHGTDELEATQLAVEEINNAGGVLGSKLSLESRDDASDKTRAPTVAQELVALGVPAIIGASGTSVTQAMATVTIPAQIPTLSPGATSPALTSLQDDGFVFRTAPSDALQGKLLSQRAVAKGFRNVAIIHSSNAYGTGLADAFSTGFAAQGGTVTKSSEYTDAQGSYQDVLASVLGTATAPEAVLLIAYQVDGAQIIKDYLNQFSSKNVFWFFTDSTNTPDFVTLVGASAFANMRHEGTVPGIPQNSRYAAFHDAFVRKYGAQPGVYASNSYDAVYLVALAIAKAGKAEGPAIRDSLPLVATGTGQIFGPSEFNAALEAIAQGQGVNFEGASGNCDFDAHGDVVGPYDIWQVSNGVVVVTEHNLSP